jgi:hypothetical protein
MRKGAKSRIWRPEVHNESRHELARLLHHFPHGMSLSCQTFHPQGTFRGHECSFVNNAFHSTPLYAQLKYFTLHEW